jgi:hypothetical protein
MSAVNGLAFFQDRGWTAAQSAGILGNLQAESNMRVDAVGDGGRAYGVAQWHPDRQATFARVIGKPIRGSNLTEQLAFVDWELKNTESAAGKALGTTSTAGAAAETVMRRYERPADSSSLGKRIANATNILAKGGDLANLGASLGDKAFDGATGALDLLLPGVGSAINKIGGMFGLGTGEETWLEKFQRWLAESDFFQRAALFTVAIIIFWAAFYLMKER